jgi:ankyrin repeat protein
MYHTIIIEKSILKAIGSGLDTKARSILTHNEQLLSLRFTKKIWNESLKSASVDVIDYILNISPHRFNINPSAVNNYTIRWASQNGHSEVVKILLTDDRVDPSANDNFSIRWASQNGHLEVVKILLTDERVDPSARNNEAIKWASEYGHLEVVKILLEQ